MDTAKLVKDIDTLYRFIEAYYPRRSGNQLHRIVSFPLTVDRELDYAKMRELIKKRSMKKIVRKRNTQLEIEV